MHATPCFAKLFAKCCCVTFRGSFLSRKFLVIWQYCGLYIIICTSILSVSLRWRKITCPKAVILHTSCTILCYFSKFDVNKIELNCFFNCLTITSLPPSLPPFFWAGTGAMLSFQHLLLLPSKETPKTMT